METGVSGGGLTWANGPLFTYFAVSLTLTLLIGLAILLWKMKKIKRECRKTIAKKYAPEEIISHDNMANYFGMEAYKGKQVRGNGVLILAKRELYFLRLLPKLEIIIPLKKIKKVISPTQYLGKTVIKPLLKVEYKDDKGKMNSVAWHVRDLETFKKALKLQIKNSAPRKRH